MAFCFISSTQKLGILNSLVFDWSSLFLFNGIFFSLIGLVSILSLPKSSFRAHLFLGILLISVAIILSERIARFSGIYEQIPQILFISGPFLVTIYPLTFLYQKSLRGRPKYWFLHLFVPVVSFFLLPSYLMDGPQKLSMYKAGSEDPWWLTLLYFSYALGYIVGIYINNFKHHYFLSSRYADSKVDTHFAINRSIALGSTTYICIPIAFALGYVGLEKEILEFIRKSLFVLFSFTPLLFFFALLKSRTIFLLETPEILEHHDNSIEEESDKWQQLADFMEKEAPYLNPSLTLYDLSRQVGIGRSELSRLINSRYKNNFYEFINQYRVTHFVDRIKKGDHQKISLEGLTLECGFRSYTTFYRVFKRIRKQTPRSFVKNF